MGPVGLDERKPGTADGALLRTYGTGTGWAGGPGPGKPGGAAFEVDGAAA